MPRGGGGPSQQVGGGVREGGRGAVPGGGGGPGQQVGVRGGGMGGVWEGGRCAVPGGGGGHGQQVGVRGEGGREGVARCLVEAGALVSRWV